MPVPLSTAAFAFAGVLLGSGSEIGALIAASAAMLNQGIVTYGAIRAGVPDDGLG